MRALARRIEALEDEVLPSRRTVLLWRDYGETAEQVISRYVAAHPEDADADKSVLSWSLPHSDEAPTEQSA